VLCLLEYLSLGTMSIQIAAGVLLVSAASLVRGIDPAHAVNITVYHVNPKRYGANPINMDTGDEPGDMFFDFHNVLITPLQCPDGAASGHGCNNPEAIAPDLMVNKVVLEVDSRFSGYARCNVGVNGSAGGTPCPDDTYCCQCGSGYGPGSAVPCNKTVGFANIFETHATRNCDSSSPAWECYKDNSAKKLTSQTPGSWYSSLKEGYCGDVANPYGANCTWRLVSVPKIVTKQCHNSVFLGAVEAEGQSCFSKCGVDTKNISSPCWANCFYETTLGPDAGKAGGTVAGIPLDKLLNAWMAPFASDDPAKGGCPGISATAEETAAQIVV